MKKVDDTTKNQQETRRERLKRIGFQKGQSGNPEGRPKGTYSLVTILKKKLAEAVKKGGKEAGEELVEIWINKAKTDRDFNALKEIVRYTDGMPKEQVEHSGGIVVGKVDSKQLNKFIIWRKQQLKK